MIIGIRWRRSVRIWHWHGDCFAERTVGWVGVCCIMLSKVWIAVVKIVVVGRGIVVVIEAVRILVLVHIAVRVGCIWRSAHVRCLRVRLCVGEKNRALLVAAVTARSATNHGAGTSVGCAVVNDANLRTFHANALVVRQVAGVLQTVLAANGEPACTTPDGLEQVKRVHGIDESPETIAAAFIGGFAVSEEVGHLALIGIGDNIRLVGEGPQVQDREDEHFNVDHQFGQGVLQIWHGDLLGSVDCAT